MPFNDVLSYRGYVWSTINKHIGGFGGMLRTGAVVDRRQGNLRDRNGQLQ